MDRVTEAYRQVYGWKIKDGDEIVPPYRVTPLPGFVLDRISWVSKEMQRGGGLAFRGMLSMLVDIDKDEHELKVAWELGAISEYMPFTKEYKEWLGDPILGDVRSVAVMIAAIYWDKKENTDD